MERSCGGRTGGCARRGMKAGECGGVCSSWKGTNGCAGPAVAASGSAFRGFSRGCGRPNRSGAASVRSTLMASAAVAWVNGKDSRARRWNAGFAGIWNCSPGNARAGSVRRFWALTSTSLPGVASLRCCGLAPLVQLGHTLYAWRDEIACMWRFTRNNGITEGFHTKMELLQRQAYGFRNFQNYRLRVSVMCS